MLPGIAQLSIEYSPFKPAMAAFIDAATLSNQTYLATVIYFCQEIVFSHYIEN
jgi:hypothetical protein